jgi:hypothetical protein
MGVFQNNLLAGAAAAASAGGGAFYSHQIEQSARFDRASSSYLTWTPSSAPSSDKIFTLSCWVKRSGQGNAVETIIGADDSSAGKYNVLVFQASSGAEDLTHQIAGGGAVSSLTADNAFRDTGGWNHIVWRVDTTDGTAGNRNRLYLNGNLTTSKSGSQPSQNATLDWNSNAEQQFVGLFGDGSSHAFDGYLAEVINCDGQSYAPTQFGETKNGVWIPKDPTGTTFGTNGFHLKFENASDLGNDSSGNNNDLTPNNMDPDHQVLDSPTFGS